MQKGKETAVRCVLEKHEENSYGWAQPIPEKSGKTSVGSLKENFRQSLRKSFKKGCITNSLDVYFSIAKLEILTLRFQDFAQYSFLRNTVLIFRWAGHVE